MGKLYEMPPAAGGPEEEQTTPEGWVVRDTRDPVAEGHALSFCRPLSEFIDQLRPSSKSSDGRLYEIQNLAEVTSHLGSIQEVLASLPPEEQENCIVEVVGTPKLNGRVEVILKGPMNTTSVLYTAQFLDMYVASTYPKGKSEFEDFIRWKIKPVSEAWQRYDAIRKAPKRKPWERGGSGKEVPWDERKAA